MSEVHVNVVPADRLHVTLSLPLGGLGAAPPGAANTTVIPSARSSTQKVRPSIVLLLISRLPASDPRLRRRQGTCRNAGNLECLALHVDRAPARVRADAA